MFESENKREELTEQVEELVSRKRYAELRDLLLPMEAADIAWLFDELDEDDEDLLDLDDFFEIECPSCGEDIIIDESVLDVGEVVCPNCGDSFSLDLVVEDEEKDEDED